VGDTQGDAERFTSLINDVEAKLFIERRGQRVRWTMA
jgi:predicted phage-related endonuclease